MFVTVIRRFSRTRGKSQRDLALRRRLAVEHLEQRTMLSIGPSSIINTGAGSGVGDGLPASSAAQPQTLASLPVATQQAVSSAIGQDQSTYHAAVGAAGATLTNLANGFTAEVQSGALHVSAGSDTWDMSLAGLSYGGAVQPVGAAQTSVNGNRVDSNYGTIDEWYVNGPGGLEQGFNVAPLPQSDASGSLTVELALGGDLTGTVNAAGDGLTLTRPDGSAVLGYTGLVAYDATGKTLPAWLEVRNDGGHQDLLIHVNDAGAQGLITIDPFLQEAKLTASDGEPDNYFGGTISISGNRMVVGAEGATVGTNSGQGAVYVFTETGSVWAQTAKLTASDGEPDNYFGSFVSISGNTVVVGAYGATVGTNSYQGAAYVFTETGSVWAQTAKLTASDGEPEDYFGCSASFSGNTVVVGAYGATVGTNSGQGAVYVFATPVQAPPEVTNVVIDSTAWNSTFLSYLASLGSQNVGGYSIPVGSGAQLTTLPWDNIKALENNKLPELALIG